MPTSTNAAGKLTCFSASLMVFITTESGYAVEGYEVEAAGFLIKEEVQQKKRFERLMERVERRLQLDTFLDFTPYNSPLQIPAGAILYADVLEHNMQVHVSDNLYTRRMTMEELKALLPDDGRFFKCHRCIHTQFGRAALEKTYMARSIAKVRGASEWKFSFSSCVPPFPLRALFFLYWNFPWRSRSLALGQLPALPVLLPPDSVMLRFFRRTSQAVLGTEALFLWNTIWLIPAMVTTVILLFTNTYYETSSSWQFLLTRVVLLICVLAVYVLLLRGIASVQRQSTLEFQARQSKQILSFQRTQYAHLQDYMEEIRRARHDLHQHQRMILSFLESGSQEELRSYLQTQIAAHPAESFQSCCLNCAVNALLNYYAKLISASSVDLEIEADLPEHLSVPEPDLCVALGNMIENAMEACAGQESPLIRIAARRTDAQAITLIVDNTAPDAPQRQAHGSFLSSKHSGAGIGTQSVQYIAQQYGGTADFVWKDNMFYASLFLNPGSRPADPPRQP